MRRRLLVIICALAVSQFIRADPTVYRIGVLADTDKTEGGELASLIADHLRRSKDVIIDDQSPDFIVSCFAIHLNSSRLDHVRIVASVALMRRDRMLSEHFALTADDLQSLAQKVAAEFNKRELDRFRRADAPQK
jgi:hypothetical protein